jgi:hypothetical protein
MSNVAMRHRPIFGGVFGQGRYAMATMPCIVKGLHAVRFMVIEPGTGAVLSLADDKVSALDAARDALQVGQLLALDEEGHEHRQGLLFPHEAPVSRPIVDRRKPISKRRRTIFAKSKGKCHYCTRPLTLDGSWHVEHMLPRALGGGDEAANLVAACAPCNLAKRDRTAIEFVESRS